MQEVISSKDFPKNDNLQALSFLYSYNNQLNLYFLEGNFTNGLVIIPEISSQIEVFKNQIDPHHVMLLYYKIA